MDARRVETGLARFTLAALVVYFPAETWVSLPYGLLNPFYLVDFIAMVLMLCGAVVSLRARPEAAPAVLCAAYAWAAANGWRATWGRVLELARGGSLDHGVAEVWVVGAASAIGLACFGVSLVLVVRKRPR
jgi:hypothetical protein